MRPVSVLQSPARRAPGAIIPLVVLVIIAVGLAPGAEQTAPAYSITDLGTLGGNSSIALALNNSGQVVGFSKNAGGRTRAFLYGSGTMRDLGTLGGADSFANGISEGSRIVGRAQTSSGDFHAFATHPGRALTDITTGTVFTSPFSTATGVNELGDAVGYRMTAADHAQGRSRIFLLAGETLTDLGMIGGQDSVVVGINNSGQFAGFFGTEAHADYSDRRGFVGRLGTAPTELGTLGGRLTTPTAINNHGQVAGFAQRPDGQSHAFLYAGGPLTDLGVLSGGRQSFGYGLNDDGRVVGASDTGDLALRAFLHDGSRMVDLNTLIPAASGWVLTEARDINAGGVIVGTGVFQGRRRAFMLTPR